MRRKRHADVVVRREPTRYSCSRERAGDAVSAGRCRRVQQHIVLVKGKLRPSGVSEQEKREEEKGNPRRPRGARQERQDQRRKKPQRGCKETARRHKQPRKRRVHAAQSHRLPRSGWAARLRRRPRSRGRGCAKSWRCCRLYCGERWPGRAGAAPRGRRRRRRRRQQRGERKNSSCGVLKAPDCGRKGRAKGRAEGPCANCKQEHSNLWRGSSCGRHGCGWEQLTNSWRSARGQKSFNLNSMWY